MLLSAKSNPVPWPFSLCYVCRISHRITHFLFFGGSGGSKAARMASSKTFLSPFCWQKKKYLNAFLKYKSVMKLLLHINICCFDQGELWGWGRGKVGWILLLALTTAILITIQYSKSRVENEWLQGKGHSK